jgi:hypothetical protein
MNEQASCFGIAARTVRICDAHGKTVATSKNLRGILTFARKYPVDIVTLERHAGSYRVVFYFAPLSGRAPMGAAFTAQTLWADWRVLFDWLLRRRSWSLERVTVIGESLWREIREPAWHHVAPSIMQARGTMFTWRRAPNEAAAPRTSPTSNARH